MVLLIFLIENLWAKKSRIYREFFLRKLFCSTLIKWIIIFFIINPIEISIKISFRRIIKLPLEVFILLNPSLVTLLSNFFMFNFRKRESIRILQSLLLLKDIIWVFSILSVGTQPVSFNHIFTLLLSYVQNTILFLSIISLVMKISPKRIHSIFGFEYISDFSMKHNDYYQKT